MGMASRPSAKGGSDPAERTGAQAVERAVAVLRSLADRNATGTRLADVVSDLGLAKGTARRLLLVLIREGLVVQEPDSRRYYLGAGLFSLGSIAGARFGIRELALPNLSRLAEESGDTVYLSVRSGLDAVCIHRQEGTFPIRTLTLTVGDRRPLGVGAGSLALLASLPAPEAEAVIEANAERFGRYSDRLDAATIRRLADQARDAGYAFNDGLIVPGMCALGVSLRGRHGLPEGALSIAAIAGRMEPDRRNRLVDLLERERSVIERALSSRGQAPGSTGGRRG